MNTKEQHFLTAEIEVNAPGDKVWTLWNTPEHILQWNNLSEDWHTTKAENDLRAGGRFLYVMALKDGSFSFNFEGTYDEVKPCKMISYTLDDGRKSVIYFSDSIPVKITEMFEPDKSQPDNIQKEYCQAVLNSFKNYGEIS